MADNSKTVSTSKDKIFSYLEESCLTFGLSFGGVMGLDIAARDLARAVDPIMALEGVVHGAYAGILVGMAATYTIPVLAKSFYYGTRKEDLSLEDLLTPHGARSWRLAGLATGLALGLSLTWNAVAGQGDARTLRLSPFYDGGQQILASLETVVQPPYTPYQGKFSNVFQARID